MVTLGDNAISKEKRQDVSAMCYIVTSIYHFYLLLQFQIQIATDFTMFISQHKTLKENSIYQRQLRSSDIIVEIRNGTEQIELSVLRRGQSAFLLLLRSEVLVDTPVSGALVQCTFTLKATLVLSPTQYCFK